MLKILFQISEFVSAKADFGTELAVSTRTELDPGDDTKVLRIASQLFLRICKDEFY